MRSNMDVGICDKTKELQLDDKDRINSLTDSVYQSFPLAAFFPNGAMPADSNLQPYMPIYSVKPNRYSAYGWNRNAQQCYTDAEILLTQKIRHQYMPFVTEPGKTGHFDLSEEKKWRELWSCTTPAYNTAWHLAGSSSLTLPSRSAKDAKLFPLWQYSDTMARKIANWQSERVKDQPLELANDPTMLVFDELRDWYFNTLTETECRSENLEQIAKRQSYIKGLIHTIPNFGPDRLYLHDIQHSLDTAVQAVIDCVANKELPQLTSDIIVNGKNLETMIGTYLHYLLVDEEVANNFSTEHLDSNKAKCHLSPVCKINHYMRQQMDKSETQVDLSKYNKFYRYITSHKTDLATQVSMQMKELPSDLVKFAPFVTTQDKTNYLESLAILESLTSIRSLINSFQSLQTSLGTYIFAVNYQQSIQTLTDNYIKLVNKSNKLMKQIIKSSDTGLNLALRKVNYDISRHHHFEKNLRSLETQVTQSKTLDSQFDSYIKKSIDSIQKYQQEINKIITNAHSNVATHEIEKSMNELFVQINQLNAITPGLLGDGIIASIPAEKRVETITSGENNCDSIPESDASTTKQSDPPFDSGGWDETIKHHPITNKPIFTYRVYKQDKVVGYAEFYNQPSLCFSEDKKSHNLIKVTGVLADYSVTEDMKITETCEHLPPSVAETWYYSFKGGAINGSIRGASNALSATLQAWGFSKVTSYAMKELTYYGSTFALQAYDGYARALEYNPSASLFEAATITALDTGKRWLFSSGLNLISKALTTASEKFEQQQWSKLASTLKYTGVIVRYGIFAKNAADTGVINAAISIAAGAGTEYIVEKTGNLMLNEIVKPTH